MDDEELTRTMTATDTYIEEPKICGHKIKTKVCAFFGIGIFCIIAGAIMMIVGILGHEGHLIGILGTLVVVMGIIALSFSLSMFCCSKKSKGKKYHSHSTPIVKRPMQNNDFKKLNEQVEPMMAVSVVNESAAPKADVDTDDDYEEYEADHVMGTREDEPLTAITPSSSVTSKRTSSSDHAEDKRSSKMSASSLTGPQLA